MHIRRSKLAVVTAVVSWAWLAALSPARADTHAGGIFNECIEYGTPACDAWEAGKLWSIRNNCAEAITAVYGSGQLDLGIGEQKCTGLFVANGGLSIAACRLGYTPVLESGEAWVPEAPYFCTNFEDEPVEPDWQDTHGQDQGGQDQGGQDQGGQDQGGQDQGGQDQGSDTSGDATTSGGSQTSTSDGSSTSTSDGSTVDTSRQDLDAAYREDQERKRVAAEALNDQMAGIATDAALGGPMGGNEASGRTWHFHMSVGGGFPTVPILTNTTVTSCTSTLAGICEGEGPSSAVHSAFGVGISLELAIDPVIAPHYGFGIYNWGQIGAAAAPGTAMLAGADTLGVRGYVGSDAGISLLADVGASWRLASYSNDYTFYDGWSGTFLATHEGGDASYRAARVGGGVRACFAKQPSDRRFCKASVSLLATKEWVPQGDAPVVWRLELSGRTMLALWVEASFGYPATGTADYAVDKQSGTLLFAHIGYAFDKFGKGTRVVVEQAPGVEASSSTSASAGDRDGDSIVDADDPCPDQFGVTGGCPDAGDVVSELPAEGTSFTIAAISPDDAYYPDAASIVGLRCRGYGPQWEHPEGWVAGDATCSNGKTYSFFRVMIGP